MIKTTAKLSARFIHFIHLCVRWGFISLGILLFVFLLWLIHGIELDRVQFHGYKAEKLYLKLDKKLSLRADRVVLPRTKASPSFQRVDKTFDNIRYMLALFDEISLYRVDFDNNRFAVFYADDILYLRSDDYEIAGSMDRNGTQLIAQIPMLYIKRFNVWLQGMLRYDYDKGKLQTDGIFEVDGIKGRFHALKRADEVQFALKSDETRDIRAFISRFRLPASVEAWIVDKIRAKRYRVDYLKGRFFIKGDRNVTFDLGALKGQVRADDVTIGFHDDVPPAHAETLLVRFANHTLSFDPEGATYTGGRSLEGTRVVIRHLGDGKPAVLELDLHAVTDVEDEVQEILRAYGLNIPVRHNGMHNRLRLKLRIPLQKRDRGIKAELFATLDHGMLSIGNVRLPLCGGGKVHYYGRSVTLQEVCVEDWWYEGSVEGKIDLRAKRAALTLHLKRMALGVKKDPFLVIKRRQLPVMIGFEKALTVDIVPLALRFFKDDKRFRVIVRDLGLLRPYVRNPLFDAIGGNVTFESSDMRRFRFFGTIEKEKCVFYGKNDTCFAQVPLEGTYDGETKALYFNAFNGGFVYDSVKRRIRVDAINIDLKRLLGVQEHAKRKKRTLLHDHLVIEGKKSEIRYGRYRLVTDRYDIELFANGDIKAYGSLDGDVVKFTRKGGIFYVSAHRIKDKMLHPLIHFTGLKKGRYSLKLEGNPDTRMKGRIIVEGGVLSDFKAYNNTLAFINAVPALATLNRPGFSKEGFTIEAGVVDYRIDGERLRLERVYLKGKTATVVGKGTVDLKSGKLNIDLAVRTVKDFAKIVGNIPVVGYLLLGDDRSVTIGLKIKGTLQKPKVETSVAKDILLMPVRVIERIITSPTKLDDTPTLPQLPPLPEKKIEQRDSKELY